MDRHNIGHHISQQFNEELEDIRNKVLAMGGMVEQQLTDAISAVITGDGRLGEVVVTNDHKTKHHTKMERPKNNYAEIGHMGDHVRQMLHNALDAFARVDAEAAVRVAREDMGIDREYEATMRQLITFMMEDPRSITRVLDVIWTARALERIGDHARNICEYVIYLVRGKDVRHTSYEQMEQEVRSHHSVNKTPSTSRLSNKTGRFAACHFS